MKPCPYCENPNAKQRRDYAGNPAGVMCDECWKTSGLNFQGFQLEINGNEYGEFSTVTDALVCIEGLIENGDLETIYADELDIHITK